MLKYDDLKNRPKELLAATGLNVDESEALLAVFGETVDGKQRRRSGGQLTLSAMNDKLLFILVYEKTYLLQTMLGWQFGLSQSRTNIWIHRLWPVVQQALERMKLTPNGMDKPSPRVRWRVRGRGPGDQRDRVPPRAAPE